MYLPARSPPTNEMALIRGSLQINLTGSIVPCTTCKTPLGKPACSINSARIMVAPGSRSDGLRIRELPVAVAIAIAQRGIIAETAHVESVSVSGSPSRRIFAQRPDNAPGKLKGQTAATTPSGSLRMYVSMSFETSIWSPSMSDGTPHAVSTTWRPRSTSPLASANVLPCSRTIDRAISSWFSLMSCWNLRVIGTASSEPHCGGKEGNLLRAAL